MVLIFNGMQVMVPWAAAELLKTIRDAIEEVHTISIFN